MSHIPSDSKRLTPEDVNSYLSPTMMHKVDKRKGISKFGQGLKNIGEMIVAKVRRIAHKVWTGKTANNSSVSIKLKAEVIKLISDADVILGGDNNGGELKKFEENVDKANKILKKLISSGAGKGTFNIGNAKEDRLELLKFVGDELSALKSRIEVKLQANVDNEPQIGREQDLLQMPQKQKVSFQKEVQKSEHDETPAVLSRGGKQPHVSAHIERNEESLSEVSKKPENNPKAYPVSKEVLAKQEKEYEEMAKLAKEPESHGADEKGALNAALLDLVDMAKVLESNSMSKKDRDKLTSLLEDYSPTGKLLHDHERAREVLDIVLQNLFNNGAVSIDNKIIKFKENRIEDSYRKAMQLYIKVGKIQIKLDIHKNHKSSKIAEEEEIGKLKSSNDKLRSDIDPPKTQKNKSAKKEIKELYKDLKSLVQKAEELYDLYGALGGLGSSKNKELDRLLAIPENDSHSKLNNAKSIIALIDEGLDKIEKQLINEGKELDEKFKTLYEKIVKKVYIIERKLAK
ncbi:MAG: hypothetical protein H0X29_04580 [Parachlamydiaceae bacterium]|nr:hypothetical protein [Parachlamydiaceae bacterium]